MRILRMRYALSHGILESDREYNRVTISCLERQFEQNGIDVFN